MDPAGCLAQTRTQLAVLSLHERDFARRCRRFRVDAVDSAPSFPGRIDPPLPEEALWGGRLVITVNQEFCNIEADTSGANDGDALADLLGEG